MTWSPRVQVKRTAKRGLYSRDVIDAILDEAFYGHVGFSHDGNPFVIPMVYGRDDDVLYLHGSVASRQLRTLAAGAPVCVTVTNIRALVLARSALNLSVNYQSAVILGHAVPVTDADEKLRALRTITDHVIPGCWEGLRPPSPKEFKAVSVLRLSIREASAKIRQAPPFEEEGDERRPVWGGLIPVATNYGPPEPDQWADMDPPSYVANYQRPLAPPPPASAYGYSRGEDEAP